MVSPPIWIGFIIVACGISTLCMAAVTNYAGIMATRFFLGLFEAGYDEWQFITNA
ncbi:hypothetical protein DSO57_1008815 [Entomophthora muscae]|uniref:Uncharacterized protein n=1 Tax=Entomophthora muscae TaxID=34485 RepID=A0ACC2USG6_9FUNG|nr:hypothetical protein DSO57_1008815 [Entomophthora muscae]